MFSWSLFFLIYGLMAAIALIVVVVLYFGVVAIFDLHPWMWIQGMVCAV